MTIHHSEFYYLHPPPHNDHNDTLDKLPSEI